MKNEVNKYFFKSLTWIWVYVVCLQQFSKSETVCPFTLQNVKHSRYQKQCVSYNIAGYHRFSRAETMCVLSHCRMSNILQIRNNLNPFTLQDVKHSPNQKQCSVRLLHYRISGMLCFPNKEQCVPYNICRTSDIRHFVFSKSEIVYAM